MNNFNTNLLIFFVLLCPATLNAQRVGIGTNSPSEMLDVNGRMRIRNVVGETAGIYFNNNTLANRSFAGIVNADYMGFWGVASGWGMVMNTNNGNVGIGTSSPTTKLDVNGTLRIRQNAKAGSVMTGLNTQGHMGWVGPVYFLTMGTPTGADFKIPGEYSFNYSRLPFAAPDINHGNGWDANNHAFIAPLKGIYHFSAHIELKEPRQTLLIRVRKWSNNQHTDLYVGKNMIFAGEYLLDVTRPYEINLDTKLEANDVVWLEVSNNFIGYKCVLTGSRPQYYFSGQLVILQ